MTTSAGTPRYRPEIDGLRALAVLAVVLFHYRFAWFRGGFVGVDVFFVISGYLITQLIEAERREGRFSFANFYERRLRRIFPALFAMLAVATLAAILILFPVDLVRYANSLLATAAFASNIEFWREAGYFDVVAAEKPLLHLWSIAVEEQFYLLFPALLLAFGQSRRRLVVVVASIFAVSFAFALWCVNHEPSAAFYLLPGRAWELMLGALLALDVVPPPKWRWLHQALGLAGLAMIAAAILLYTSETPFPGAAALLPCVGAGLIVYAAAPSATLVGSLLALPPLVFIGRISYSLYLWHWPLFVFARYLDFHDPATGETVLLIALSFALATLSWLFIEQPFRRTGPRTPRRGLFAGAAAAMGASAAIALVLLAGDGFPQLLRPDIRAILAEEEDHEPRINTCFGLTAEEVRAGRLCRIGAPGGRPSFVLWGDSHGDAVLPAVSAAAAREGRTGLFAGGRSCPPLLGVTAPNRDCRPFNDAVLALAAHPDIREVILNARWAKYAEGSTYGSEPEGRVVLSDGGATDGADNHSVFARGLERTIHALAGKKIVIVASVPEIGWAVPAVLARAKLAGDWISGPSEKTYLARQKFVMAEFARLAAEDGVTIVYPHEYLCESGTCAVSRNGVPLYRDEHHLSVYGARLLTPLLGKAL